MTVLHYAGDGLFSYEEDVYNPANFAPVVSVHGCAAPTKRVQDLRATQPLVRRPGR